MAVKNVLCAALLLLLFSVSFAVPENLSIVIDSGSEYTDTTTVTVTINGSSDAVLCQLSNDDSVYEDVSGVLTFPTAMDVSWDLSSGDEEKNVYLRCANYTNGTMSSPVTDTITLDATAPEAGNLAPVNGSTTTDDTPTISAQLTDSGSDASEVDESTIVIEIDGSAVSHNYNPSLGQLSYTPSSAMSIATHNISLEFSDNAGNGASYTWEFSVNTGPSIGNLTPGEDAIITEARPMISVIVEDSGVPINESAIEFIFDGSDVSDDISFWSATGILAYEVDSSLDDDNYTVEITVYDEGGMEASEEWEFMVDRTEPEFSIELPEDLATVSTITEISVTIEDSGSGLNRSSLEMSVDGVDVTDGASFDLESGELVFEHVAGIAGGSHDVEVTIADMAGNEETFYWSFTIEESNAMVSSKTPADDSVISETTPEISAKLTDSGTSGLDLSTIRIYLDGDEVSSESTFDVSSGKLSYTPDDELDEGEHTVRVRVSNNAGQETDVRWEFNVDATPPNRATSMFVTLNGSKSVVSWKGSTSSDVAGYKIFASTSPITSVEGMSPADSVDESTLEYTRSGNVRYYFAVVAYDEAGNDAEPVFGQNCGTYNDGEWNDYECCWDFNCATGTCDVATHACDGEPAVGPVGDVSSEEASEKIDEVEDAMLDAAMEGKDVTEAGNLLDQARSAYNVGNYEQAHELATRALNALAASPATDLPEAEVEEISSGKKKLPCCPAFIFPLILISAFLWRRI